MFKTATKSHKLNWAAALFIGVSAVSMAAITAPAAAREPGVTAETLLDRIQIEDLIVEYYAKLGSGGHHNLSEYFTKDAVFIVNGKRYVGRKAIDNIYAELGAGASPLRQGTFHMLLTNPRISIDGDTATAITIWTGVMNDNIKIAPRLAEQGREYDKLKKVDGVWYFSERNIVSDSDMHDQYDETYMKDRPAID